MRNPRGQGIDYYEDEVYTRTMHCSLWSMVNPSFKKDTVYALVMSEMHAN